MFAKYLAKQYFQDIPDVSRSWKYNLYFPVAEGARKMEDYIENRGDRGVDTR